MGAIVHECITLIDYMDTVAIVREKGGVAMASGDTKSDWAGAMCAADVQRSQRRHIKRSFSPH